MDEPPGKLQSLNLVFARGLDLLIYPIRKDGQAVQFSMQGNFDFNKFKKLKIDTLVIDRQFFEENVVKRILNGEKF